MRGRQVVVVVAFAACTRPRAPSPPPPNDEALALAIWRGDRDAVRDGLERGAAPDHEPEHGKSALTWAVLAQDRPMTELLLAHAPHLTDALDTRIALRMAAARDEIWLIDALLDRGISIDGAVDERASPLMVAAENGAIVAMKRLLDRGAAVNYNDPQGDTPLAAAVRSGCTACVELLLDHHADIAHVDADGRSALGWARRTAQPAMEARLVRAGAPQEPAISRPEPPAIDVAIARAGSLLERGFASWQAGGECTSCHHLPMAVRALSAIDRLRPADHPLARDAIDAIRSDDAKFAKITRTLLAKPDDVLALSMVPAGDAAFGNAWFLSAELDAGQPAGDDQRVLAIGQARMQQPDGRWRRGPLRGVIEWSDLEATALSVHAIVGYGDAEARAALPAAARWLEHATPVSIVDHAFLLRAWRDLGRDTSREVAALRALQHDDGSWSHVPGPGDAYSTGLVAVMLVEAGGVDPHDPAIQRAASYLLRTQDADGSWLVPSRAPQLLPMCDYGFPHGKLQLISYAGTAWAAIALAYAARG